jgi:hypothetical protein
MRELHMLRKAIGLCLSLAGLLMVAVGAIGFRLVLSYAEHNATSSEPSSSGALGVVVGAVVIVALLVLMVAIRKSGSKANRYGMRWRAPYADEILAKDGRPPILLLRAFDDDENFRLNTPFFALERAKVRTLEEAIERCLKVHGPMVGIGRPGEWAPPLGASRTYVVEDWQRKVLQLIRECKLILVILSNTNGLLWEIQQLVALSVLGKVIVVLPPVRSPQLQVRWSSLVQVFSSVQGPAVPNVIPNDAVFATFSDADCCTIHHSKGLRGRRLLAPHYGHYTTPLKAILAHRHLAGFDQTQRDGHMGKVR